MLTTVQKVKETVLLSALNIVLPTGDVYSDLALITKFLTTPYVSEEVIDAIEEETGILRWMPNYWSVIEAHPTYIKALSQSPVHLKST